MSKAKYQVKGQPNIAALALTLRVYDFRVANPHLKLWEIGDQLPRFMVGNKINATDTHAEVVNKRNVLSASVARYIKKAEWRGCAGFCVNGQSPRGMSPIVRQHNDYQETRSPRRTAVWPAGRLQET